MDFREVKSPIAKAIIIEQTAQRAKTPWIVVRHDMRPIDADTDVLHDPSCRPTNGNYSVMYSPVCTNGRRYTRSVFRIVCDVLGEEHNRSGSLRCRNYADVVSRKDPWVRWMVKMTNLSQEHFDLASRNMSMKVPFTIDVKKLLAWSGDRYTPKTAQYANNFRMKSAIERRKINERKNQKQ